MEDLDEADIGDTEQQAMRTAFRSDTTCLVCQEDFENSLLTERLKKTTLVFCRSCKNFSHESGMTTQ